MGKDDEYKIVRRIIDRDPNTSYGCERQGCLILDLHKTFQVGRKKKLFYFCLIIFSTRTCFKYKRFDFPLFKKYFLFFSKFLSSKLEAQSKKKKKKL